MKKFIALFLAVVMTMCLFAGCAQNQEETPTTANPPAPTGTEPAGTDPAPTDPVVEEITLNVAYMPNYAALWAVSTAQAKGYFAEEGITVNLVQFADGPTEIAAMESGSIDVSYIGPGAHKLCSTGNASIFLLQQLGNADCVIGLKSHGVNSLSDLKGKKVAYASGTSSETILKLALESVGLTMDDIEAYDMDTSNMVTAFLSGSVDACATWSPNSLTILEQSNGDAVKFCSNVDFTDVSVSPASWVCTPQYAEAHSDYLVRFVRALYKGMEYGSKEENFQEVAGYVAAVYASDVDAAYAQRGDGDWLTKDRVVELINNNTMIEYYTLQQQAFIASGAVAEADALAVTDFVLTDIMLEAAK